MGANDSRSAVTMHVRAATDRSICGKGCSYCHNKAYIHVVANDGSGRFLLPLRERLPTVPRVVQRAPHKDVSLWQVRRVRHADTAAATAQKRRRQHHAGPGHCHGAPRWRQVSRDEQPAAVAPWPSSLGFASVLCDGEHKE
ncbi:hypothetical protein pneo_cds_608 [Pandoravirus neocaledonia]|uniref:Uncharacterized protein n=1 Tax=Pandoravirus neocaledonia TaxID=2107708 RepID=A0A2U7UCY4_9VIRU|nr:hypothetical protein pneo_cds_608 [Pandoravirus neocaledonia]AVK76215.1 hypothetical protein pneo_cds_608 [Pandoravirus neocaledonia]